MHFLHSLWDKWKDYLSNPLYTDSYIPQSHCFSLSKFFFSSGSHPFNFLSPDKHFSYNKKKTNDQTDWSKPTLFSPKRPVLESSPPKMELSCLLKLHIFPLTEEAIFTIKKIEALKHSHWREENVTLLYRGGFLSIWLSKH